MEQSMELQGKAALVTGSSAGVGRATAIAFDQAGSSWAYAGEIRMMTAMKAYNFFITRLRD